MKDCSKHAAGLCNAYRRETLVSLTHVQYQPRLISGPSSLYTLTVNNLTRLLESLLLTISLAKRRLRATPNTKHTFQEIMPKASGFYAVKKGREPGVYLTW